MNRVSLLAAVVISVFSATNLIAQIDSLRSSRWDSVYESEDGLLVRSQVVLDGNQGSYSIGRVSGTLFNVEYCELHEHPLGPPTPAIHGLWRSRGRTGYFVFREPNHRGVTDGYWGYVFGREFTEIVGSWDGQLVRNVGESPRPTVRQVDPPVAPRPTVRNLTQGRPGFGERRPSIGDVPGQRRSGPKSEPAPRPEPEPAPRPE